MALRRGAGPSRIAFLTLLAWAAAPAAEAPKKGPEPVANAQRADHARFVHRMDLKDDTGNLLGPKSLVPYSPRETCGSARCHDYEGVARGSHTIMYADLKADPKRPPVHLWTVFDAETGTQAPLSHGWLPPENYDANKHKVQITPFEMAKSLGAYHPGGGPFELDRAGERYDRKLAASLALRDDATNPDYAEARWDQSGVLEVDCLVCHKQDGYDHVERGTQISVLNYRWAATVGAGFGTVEGKVVLLPKSQPAAPPSPGAAPPEPPVKVTYKPDLFDAHGKVEVAIGRPPDRNCLFCHRKPAKGHLPWSDGWDADVHTRSGLACVDCHHATPWHAMYGSRRHGDLLASDPDFATLSCKGCHEAGRLGSPVPAHRGLPRFHLEKLACEACHVGPHPQPVPVAIEKPTNFLWGTPGGAKTNSGPTVWTPVFVKDDRGQIRPVLRLLPAFYARKTDGGLEPLTPRGVGNRFGRIAKDLKDDDGDGQPEVNSEAEILLVLKNLKRASVDPVYVVGGTAYSIDDRGGDEKDKEKWTLKSEPSPLGDPLDLRQAHNVRPAAQSLGAQGCAECHGDDSPFWQSLGLTRALGLDGRPDGQPLYARLGKTEFDLQLGDFREEYLRPYGWWVVLLGVLAMATHFVVFGPHVYPREYPEEYAQRFSVVSRLAHCTLLLSFLLLAVTGFSIAGGVERVLGLGIQPAHAVIGYALAAAGALAFLLWVKDMVFTRVDLGWVKVMGGYLGYKSHEPVPAGRFNAGQKFFFWMILVVVACLFVTGLVMARGGPARWLPLAYTLHELMAYLMVLSILGHTYLGSFANPGTLGAPFTGKVTLAWLRYHHPNYQPKPRAPKGH